MDHTHYQELTSQFIDRELGAEEERELFSHLGTCNECRQFLRATMNLQKDLLGTKPDYAGHINQSRATNPLRTIWRKRVPMSIAATLAVFALISTIAFSTVLLRPTEKVVETKEEVVYVPRLPAIQVIGFYPPAAKPEK